MKARLIPFLAFAGCIGSCGGDTAADASGGSTGGDTAADASGGSTGGDTAADASGGSTGGDSLVPTNHRPQDVNCPQERAAGRADVVGECMQDSDCTDGMNGRCISPNVVGPLGRSSCSYDTCSSDSDCPVNEPCRCRPSAADNAPNYCVARSNCRIDSDCGPGGFCSPSLLGIDGSVYSDASSGSGSVVFGYFCHTPRDLCLNNSDCDASICVIDEGCGGIACGYSSDNHWDCFRLGIH
jgi:hypothetical protein